MFEILFILFIIGLFLPKFKKTPNFQETPKEEDYNNIPYLDKMSLSLLNDLIETYIKRDTILENMNNEIFIGDHKKLRRENFPEYISENIVKFAIYKKYKIMPNWNVSSGDLELVKKNKKIKIEVKAFSSSGPSSFGPTEKWDHIYFVDCLRYKEKYFIVYEIKLSNIHKKWKNIKINKKQTYHDVCKKEKRPRIHFNHIIKQIGKRNYSIIFQDYFDSNLIL
jgi:hypothetical protein